MGEYVDWIAENKEWLFPGIGITVITGITWVLRYLFRRKKAPSSQNIDAGAGSTIVQAGRDVEIKGASSWIKKK